MELHVTHRPFVFEYSEEEWESLRSQNATLKSEGRGEHRKYVSKAFSEQGVYIPTELKYV